MRLAAIQVIELAEVHGGGPMTSTATSTPRISQRREHPAGPAHGRPGVHVRRCDPELAVLPLPRGVPRRGAARRRPGDSAAAGRLRAGAARCGQSARLTLSGRRPPSPGALTAAAGCALLANKGLIGLWAKGAGPQFAANWSASLSAPLNEEILKLCGVIMIVLAAPRMIQGPLDGMIFGALVGLGFQATENVTYGLNSIMLSGATDPAKAVRQLCAGPDRRDGARLALDHDGGRRRWRRLHRRAAARCRARRRTARGRLPADRDGHAPGL